MIESLQKNLAMEIALFKGLRELEQQKREAIMTADGKRLFEITNHQERMVHEMESLEIQLRTGITHIANENGLSPDSLKLSDIQRIVHRNTTGLARAFDAVVHEFRSEADKLQSEVSNNGRLLEGAGKAIQNTMELLRKESENSGITYNPPALEGNRRSPAITPLLLNRNA